MPGNRFALTALVCLLSIRATAQVQPAASSLQTEIQAISAAHHGKVALFAENLTTHESVAITPDLPVQTASVIKLTILYEALEQVREGQTHFEDKIELKREDQVPGSGLLRFFDTPLPLTLKDALTMMIVMSDNTATNLVIDHLGLDRINTRTKQIGLKDTYLYKKVFTKLPPGTVMPDDFKIFGLGKTTPREITTLMERFVHCDLGGPARPGDAALCNTALYMLHIQFYRAMIPRYLDGLPGAKDDSIANKTGSLEAVRVDIAAVSTKSGMVLISAFTYDNQDHSWGTEQEGELTIAKLARAIVGKWSPSGLTAWPLFPPIIPQAVEKSVDKPHVP